MPVSEQTGEFVISDYQPDEGLRQDVPLSELRYTGYRNVHSFKRRTVTKREGYRPLNSTAIAGDPDILGGYDMHHADGSQDVFAVAGTDAYLFDSTTRSFTAQGLALANVRPTLLSFADNLILMNGTQAKYHNGVAWANIGGTPPKGRYGAVHNNRLITAGVAAAPYAFYFSGVRNQDSHDTTNDVVLVSTGQGEILTGIGSLGDDLLVWTENNTILQWQNPNNKGDWDRFDVSNQIGNLHNWSYVELTHIPFGMGLFWSTEGPYVIYRIGDSKPVLRPLWNALRLAVEGIADEPATPALEPTRFNSVVGCYQPKLQQVRFACSSLGGSENNIHVWFDVPSLLEFVAGNREEPKCGIYDNESTLVYPGDAMFTVKVDTEGLPSTTGKHRMFAGRDGVIYEMDEGFDDNGEAIPFYCKRSGYTGRQEGFEENEKALTNVRLNCTQNAGFGVVVEVTADGQADTASDELDLDPGLGAWGDGGVWTADPSEGVWNGATVGTTRADMGIRGKMFDVAFYDQGAINDAWEMDRIVLEGTVYERQ